MAVEKRTSRARAPSGIILFSKLKPRYTFFFLSFIAHYSNHTVQLYNVKLYRDMTETEFSSFGRSVFDSKKFSRG